VGAPALPAHERHGDVEGACATEDGVDDGTDNGTDDGTDDDTGAGAEDAVHEEVVDSFSRGQDLYGDSAANRLRGTTRAGFLQSGRGPDIAFGNVGNDYIRRCGRHLRQRHNRWR
jgi:Ca2+-binding RTX toxin-like protein